MNIFDDNPTSTTDIIWLIKEREKDHVLPIQVK